MFDEKYQPEHAYKAKVQLFLLELEEVAEEVVEEEQVNLEWMAKACEISIDALNGAKVIQHGGLLVIAKGDLSTS